jgi:SAM-dependent methyltransferase
MDRATLVLAGHPQAARGRALTEQQLQAWSSAFGALLPERRPLAGLDVGSGTGRFTPALARAFGPVTGVEPSVRMREIAQAQSQHPGVRYLAGSAEDMPVPSGSADYAVMLQSWHHVQDKPRAARELGQGAQVRRAAATALRVQRPHAQDLVAGALPPAALRWTPRCFSRRTRSSRHSRRPAGALPASARSPNRPPTTRTTSPQPAVF